MTTQKTNDRQSLVRPDDRRNITLKNESILSQQTDQAKPSIKFTMFTPAFIDDYGFTPEEFRVFARICRRANINNICFESIPNLVKSLQISRGLVRRALKVLEACGAIIRSHRSGGTDEIEFTACDLWISSAELPGIRERVRKQTGSENSPGIKRPGGRSENGLGGGAENSPQRYYLPKEDKKGDRPTAVVSTKKPETKSADPTDTTEQFLERKQGEFPLVDVRALFRRFCNYCRDEGSNPGRQRFQTWLEREEVPLIPEYGDERVTAATHINPMTGRGFV